MLLPKLGGFWLLPPRDFPHQMRVTLWITTAIHLDTPIRMPGTKMLSSYINCPFKPDGQPANVQIGEPEPRNILTAMAENESVVKKETDPERKAIALASLFHLVGDIHQPLHT